MVKVAGSVKEQSLKRLEALNGTKWSVANILNEILPEQRNLCDVRLLLESTLQDRKSVDARKRKITGDDTHKRSRSVVPLRAAHVPLHCSVGLAEASTKQRRVVPSDRYSPRNSFRKHALLVWEDKFRSKSIEVKDILFLLTHPNVANTLENASFMRELNLTYDQVMELEMTLVMLRRQEEWTNARSHRISSTSLCDKLARNAWIHGRVLLSARTSCAVLPEVILSRRVASRNITRAKLQNQERMPIKTSSALTSPITPNLEVCPPDIREWVRDNCLEEVTRSVTMRKQFGADKLGIVVSRHLRQVKSRRFSHWYQQMLWMQCQQQIHSFCRLKCALWVLQKSRKRLGKAVFRLWGRWMVNLACQRENEVIAATVIIQSWIRGVQGKRTAAVHHLNLAATLIQTRWRGIHARRMFKRKKRFVAYNAAAHQVQRFYVAYLFRMRCEEWVKQQRASRVIMRTFARYIEKKRDNIAWRHHLARYHAAISIQVWMRRTRRRIASVKSRRDKRAKAKRVLFNFFRYAWFIRCFSLRVENVVRRRTAAAVLLQNAYRAKQARARFYELKVHLEDQRRQEILTLMWNNAYATTIQKWWRKRHRQRSHGLLIKNKT